jgi:toxin CcdB
MPQFAVYKNRNEATRGRFPLLLDVQSELLEPLNTRVVVPLSPVATARARAMQALTPNLTVAGKEYIMVTPQLAGISVRDLGTIVDTVSSERARIIGAIDLLITGI